MEATLFLLSICFTLIIGQAPGDYQEICRTDHRYRVDHDWIPYVNDTSVGVRGNVKWQVLVDQYDYQTLLGAGTPPAVWTSRNVDGDNLQFITSGGVCRFSVQITSPLNFQNPNANNWVFTQSVNYLDAIEVVVNATVRFTACVQRMTTDPPCRQNYVTLHRYDTNSQTVANNQRIDINNYQPYLDNNERSRLVQIGERDDTNIIRTYLRPQNFNFTYFGIQDTGTLGMVQRILVYYRVGQGYEEGLVICPSVALPQQGSGSTNIKSCVCKGNAIATTNLERSCDENGVCVQNPVCECNPGYQYNATLRICQGCPMGTYKRGVSNTSRCIPCPAGSMTINESSTVCNCVRGTVRCPSRPDDACQSVEEFLQNPSQCQTESSSVANTGISRDGAIAITFFVTLIITAVVTAVILFLILWFIFVRNK